MREHRCGKGGERGQGIRSGLCADSREPCGGLELTNLRAWPEPKAASSLSHPGTPPFHHLKITNLLSSGLHSFWGLWQFLPLFLFSVEGFTIFLCILDFDNLMVMCRGKLRSMGQIWNIFNHYFKRFSPFVLLLGSMYVWPLYIVPQITEALLNFSNLFPLCFILDTFSVATGIFFLQYLTCCYSYPVKFSLEIMYF